MSLQEAVYEYIKNNDKMSAPPSVVGRALDPNYKWSNLPKYAHIINSLKKSNKIKEFNGRYYVQ